MLRSRKGPVCDRFGQSMKVEWPGKVHRDEELKADLTSDRAYYRSFTPLATDAFGGKLDREIHWNAGGFFKLGKYNGHDIFISPDGNPFFSWRSAQLLRVMIIPMSGAVKICTRSFRLGKLPLTRPG